MKLKLTVFLAAVVFLAACGGYEIVKKEENVEKTKKTEITTTDGDTKVNIDDGGKVEVNEDGKTVEINKDGVKVNDDKTVDISKDGVKVNADGKKISISTDGVSIEDGGDSKGGDAGESLSLKGVGETKTVACNGRKIMINGTKNDYTLTGECPRVLVNGASQTVSIEKAGTINVNGANNAVKYSEGIGGKTPRISKAGVNNSVDKK